MRGRLSTPLYGHLNQSFPIVREPLLDGLCRFEHSRASCPKAAPCLNDQRSNLMAIAHTMSTPCYVVGQDRSTGEYGGRFSKFHAPRRLCRMSVSTVSIYLLIPVRRLCHVPHAVTSLACDTTSTFGCHCFYVPRCKTVPSHFNPSNRLPS